MKRVLLAILLVCLLCGCKKQSRQDTFLEGLGIDISTAEIATQIDTHGGFHGDGVTYTVLKNLPIEATVEEISRTEGWKPLPVTENVTILLYGLQKGNHTYGPYLQLDGKAVFPQVEKGYFYFLNRQKDIHEDVGIFDEHSHNLTVAIFDSSNGCLYYGELDT